MTVCPGGCRKMKHMSVDSEKDPEVLRQRAALNRMKAQAARSTQQRQYFDGMAAHWEELADDIAAGRTDLAEGPGER